MNRTQWATLADGSAYVPAGETVMPLPPGIYDPALVPNIGVVLIPVRQRTDDVLRFPNSPADSVVAEIERFWVKEGSFELHGLPFKRGILMYGPPGSGKSATLRLVVADVIERGGVVLNFSPGAFLPAYRALRDVEPDRKLVVLMEDLDSILTNQNISAILNILDGAENVERTVFVATTNYVEQLQERIGNRPSRFDRKVLIDHPEPAARRMYLEALVREGDELDMAKWVKESDGLSVAHLKELFVSVQILDNPYDVTLKQLKGMGDRVTSADDPRVRTGQYA